MKENLDILRAFAGEALRLPSVSDIAVTALGGRGSDRAYFRVTWGHESAILVHYDPKRIENAYFADIALFLADIGVPAPRIARHDRSRCLILMEDLGDEDLWSLRAIPWQERSTLYRKTLVIVDRLHSVPPGAFPADKVRLMEPFSPELYRWERDYFRDHFVKELCGIELEPAFGKELEEELLGLSERVGGAGRCLVHRDFQSQNVMIRDGEPILIDFQGMRFGSLFYDLGSLLCDPYVRLGSAERDGLLSFYYGLSERAQGWPEFRERFWEASAQRLMQALGAYGLLGLGKGLRAYLEHVPAGLENLTSAARHAGTVPRLVELCERCAGAPGLKRNLAFA